MIYRKAAIALYRGRKLAQGYPDLETKAAATFQTTQTEDTRTEEIMRCIDRATDLPSHTRSLAVIGCGPRPKAVKELRALGYDAVGIEPFEHFAVAARAYMGDDTAIKIGNAEQLSLESESGRGPTSSATEA